ncbi:hypothetical protein GCM10009788_21580 [Nocardioides humi]|uniref:Uncharacterized protein n=1 Tax=Nocardioides humi TaxID=449461 RepID=A0ABN2AF98_9ACTN
MDQADAGPGPGKGRPECHRGDPAFVPAHDHGAADRLQRMSESMVAVPEDREDPASPVVHEDLGQHRCTVAARRGARLIHRMLVHAAIVAAPASAAVTRSGPICPVPVGAVRMPDWLAS